MLLLLLAACGNTDTDTDRSSLVFGEHEIAFDEVFVTVDDGDSTLIEYFSHDGVEEGEAPLVAFRCEWDGLPVEGGEMVVEHEIVELEYTEHWAASVLVRFDIVEGIEQGDLIAGTVEVVLEGQGYDDVVGEFYSTTRREELLD